MYVKVALIISIIMQVMTAGYAIGLIRKTKFNISWILLSLGFLLMAIRRVYELPQVVDGVIVDSPFNLGLSWVGVFSSFFFLIGMIFIRKIFKKLDDAEQMRDEIDRKVLDAIIDAEETERRRIAKELHDGIGPLLSNLKMSISALKPSQGQENIVAGMKHVVNESIIVIREISNNLSPHVLENFGLLSALKTFSAKITESQTVHFTFDENVGDKRFKAKEEIVLYRVLCELINNTIKHAKASEILIRMRLIGNFFLIDYFDNGIGMPNKEEFEKQTGMGIYNMASRLKSVNGSIRIDLPEKNGFQAFISCPVEVVSQNMNDNGKEHPYRNS